ncbi:MAG: hypothetical protein AAFR66_21280, partial [Bacteroidota bacterium]
MLLEISYVALMILMNVIIYLIGQYAIERTSESPSEARKLKLKLAAYLTSWQVYLFGIASTGILQNYSPPPRFVIFLVLPAFIFIGVFLSRNKSKRWIAGIPKSWAVYYQTFRILIESLFVFSVAAGTLHYHVTIEGYNFDMIFAFTAPVIGFLVFGRKILPVAVVKVWNYLGLTVIASIIFLFLTTTMLPEMYGSTEPLLPKEFGMYPYVVVPGFLMPSAVFMHVFSLVQLSRKSKE